MLTREQYTKQYYPIIYQLCKGTGIFPEVMLAQSIIESSGKVNGVYYPAESSLAKLANNYFGIKASSGWNGDTISLNTGEYLNGNYVTVTGKFRKYAHPSDSFKDYINFLKVNPRYTTAGVFTAPTPTVQAQRLQAAGYATDPNYANLVMGVFNGVKKYLPEIKTVAAGGLALATLIVTYFFFKKK